MDRRLHPRYATDIEVHVTELPGQRYSGIGRLIDISNSGVGLWMPEQLGPGDVLRLEIAATVFYGHVVHVRPDRGGGGFNVGIEIQQVVFGESALSVLLPHTEVAQIPPVSIPTESNANVALEALSSETVA